MGLVEPPWVDKKFFDSVPFNYCDHFGDKEELSLMCKICKDEIEWKEKLREEGRDPNSWDEVFKEVGKNLALAMAMIRRDAKRLGIDLNNIEDESNPREIQPRRYSIYRVIEKYGYKVEKAIKDLEFVPKEANIFLLKKAMDVFSHSRFYAQVKIHRALASRKEETDDEIMRELADSKTSALLAYIAIERNSRVFFRLSNHKPLVYLKSKLLKLSILSLELANLIENDFYPDDKFELKEFGCSNYNKVFKPFVI